MIRRILVATAIAGMAVIVPAGMASAQAQDPIKDVLGLVFGALQEGGLSDLAGGAAGLGGLGD
ncbi:hypothetical protein [Spongiactinospora sp. TRM90649]|uniref:hypothetical protein n=1 Tax=Spongiactinospora sp. TRM90649 TaxID=3031114 RepID=UPI0023FA3BF1|nr:hypothetical protein [Spongiactinospora sp. TRM90649]MDF5757841.1 hypothetical protein [Spongiactinospora sp. TRM90649]